MTCLRDVSRHGQQADVFARLLPSDVREVDISQLGLTPRFLKQAWGPPKRSRCCGALRVAGRSTRPTRRSRNSAAPPRRSSSPSTSRSPELRREIHEGLQVVENWNSANTEVFYGKDRAHRLRSRAPGSVDARAAPPAVRARARQYPAGPRSAGRPCVGPNGSPIMIGERCRRCSGRTSTPMAPSTST